MPNKTSKLSPKMQWFRQNKQYLKIDTRGPGTGCLSIEGNWEESAGMHSAMIALIIAITNCEDKEAFWKALAKFAFKWTLKK